MFRYLGHKLTSFSSSSWLLIFYAIQTTLILSEASITLMFTFFKVSSEALFLKGNFPVQVLYRQGKSYS